MSNNMVKSISKKDALPSKWLIVGAMMVFVGTAFLGIAVNSVIFRHGFYTEWSISHYVGLEIWSAILFTLGNIFVTIFMGRYLWQLGEAWKMPRVFYWLIVVLVVTLLGLSFCPSGMFDEGDSTSIITWIHILTSRGMFIAMMLVAAMIVISRHANALAHLVNVLYLIYAVVCIVGFMTEAEWFMSNVMVFETLYIMAFMTALAFCDDRREKLSDLYQS